MANVRYKEYSNPKFQEIRKIGKFGPVISFEIDEGQVTIHKGTGIQGRRRVITFANEGAKGDYVYLKGDMLVEKADNSHTDIIGCLYAEPTFVTDEPTLEGHTLGTPFNWTETDGDDTVWYYRAVSVELFGTKVLRIPVDISTKVDLGSYLEYAGNNKFKASSKKTSGIIALESSAAGTTGDIKNITALFGYYGRSN